MVKDGWEGVCVEPNPITFERLKKNLSQFPLIKLEQVAITTKDGPVKLFSDSNDSSGLFASTLKKNLNPSSLLDSFEVVGLTPTSLLKKHNIPKEFDLLSIDTEGLDYEILCQFPFELYHPKLIITEKNTPSVEAKKVALLKSKKYKLATKVGCNTFWVSLD